MLDPAVQISQDNRRSRRKARLGLGLQGRLVISFMLLLTLGLEADALLYAHQTEQRFAELLSEQARQIAYGLSMASQQPLADGQLQHVSRMGRDALHTRNMLFVIFYDPQFHPIAQAMRN